MFGMEERPCQVVNGWLHLWTHFLPRELFLQVCAAPSPAPTGEIAGSAPTVVCVAPASIHCIASGCASPRPAKTRS